ncbi:17362_t:CDS:2, partial [Acaulospora colombiana]
NQVLVGILVNDLEPDVKTDMVIVLDGEARNFYHISENTGAITTNIIAYFSHDIPLAVHTLSVEASANSLILFDYIAYDSGKLANTGGGSTSGSQGPSSITSTSTSGSLVSITSNSGGPSGTKTTSGSSGTGLTSTFSRAGTSIDVATITALNVQAFTVPLFTTTDAEGRTYYPPELTALPNGSDPSNVGSGNSNGTSSDSYVTTSIVYFEELSERLLQHWPPSLSSSSCSACEGDAVWLHKLDQVQLNPTSWRVHQQTPRRRARAPTSAFPQNPSHILAPHSAFTTLFLL